MATPLDHLQASEERLQAAIEQRDSANTDIRTRLLAVYSSIPQIITDMKGENTLPIPWHLEMGFYDGFQLSTIGQWAKNIVGIDIDHKYKWAAEGRKDVKPLLQEGRLYLEHGDAMSLDFDENSFGSMTLVEILGTEEDQMGKNIEDTQKRMNDIYTIFSEAYRVLEPGGILVFTVRDRNMNSLMPRSFGGDRGVLVSREEMEDEILKPIFGGVTWYGQFVCDVDPERGRWVLPSGVDFNEDKEPKGLWTPQKITDPQTQRPLYWIGACQKTPY